MHTTNPIFKNIKKLTKIAYKVLNQNKVDEGEMKAKDLIFLRMIPLTR